MTKYDTFIDLDKTKPVVKWFSLWLVANLISLVKSFNRFWFYVVMCLCEHFWGSFSYDTCCIFLFMIYYDFCVPLAVLWSVCLSVWQLWRYHRTREKKQRYQHSHQGNTTDIKMVICIYRVGTDITSKKLISEDSKDDSNISLIGRSRCQPKKTDICIWIHCSSHKFSVLFWLIPWSPENILDFFLII